MYTAGYTLSLITLTIAIAIFCLFRWETLLFLPPPAIKTSVRCPADVDSQHNCAMTSNCEFWYFFRKLHCTRNYIHIQMFISFILRAAFIFIRDSLLFTNEELYHCDYYPVRISCHTLRMMMISWCLDTHFDALRIQTVHLHLMKRDANANLCMLTKWYSGDNSDALPQVVLVSFIRKQHKAASWLHTERCGLFPQHSPSLLCGRWRARSCWCFPTTPSWQTTAGCWWRVTSSSPWWAAPSSPWGNTSPGTSS